MTGVSVTVRNGSIGKAGVRVLLHDAAGAVTGEAVTDANGKAALATVPAMVTVLGMVDGQPALSTFLGVTDGDNLAVSLGRANVAPSPAGTYAATFQSPYVAEATRYQVGAGACSAETSDPSLPVAVALTSTCVGAHAALASAFIGAATPPVGFAFAKNIATPAAGATVNVGPLAFAAPGATTITASNFAADVTIKVASLYALVNGVMFQGNGLGTLDSGSATFVTATGFADAYQSQLYADAGPARRMFVRREATTAPATTTLPNFDFAKALPIVSGKIAKAVPARPDVTLTSDGPAGADGGVVLLAWGEAHWMFMVPATTAAFRAPALPVDATAFAPTDSVDVRAVVFVESTLIPDYRALKTLPLPDPLTAVLSSGIVVDLQMPLPKDGLARMSQWVNPL